MIEIFLQTLPFFLLIGLGYGAARVGMFNQDATAHLTKFVFYFALSAMLFNFAATLPISEVFNARFVTSYLMGCLTVYALATAVALWRKIGMAEAAVEAQTAIIGNVGFLGIPMFVMIMGPASTGPMLMVLAVDLIVFSSLIVLLITGAKEGKLQLSILRTLAIGLLKNPMIVSITLGLFWSASGWTLAKPAAETLNILGAAATPGALFAIGASLGTKSAERAVTASWLAFCKLFLHPAAVALFALVLLPVTPFEAMVMISAAALPVAGNVFMIAQNYGVAPQRVSSTILISTIASIVTMSVIIGWLKPLGDL